MTQEDQPVASWMKPSAVTADDPMASKPARRTYTHGRNTALRLTPSVISDLRYTLLR